MIRLWVNGSRRPSQDYAALLARAFGISQTPAPGERAEDFLEFVDRADDTLDQDLLNALEAQTQSLRMLDRLLGATRVLSQAEAHARTTADLVQWAPFGQRRRHLAATGAEAAALAGWQALDLGKPKTAWKLHTLGRSLAQESEDPSVIAHVTTQQAYALLDIGRVDQALDHVRAARAAAGSRVPSLVRAWLAAAEAEMRAAIGDTASTVRMLDQAAEHLDAADADLPFIFLDDAHLVRWRGHCLARLGHVEAVPVLAEAQKRLDPQFHRAAASLHIDLATAYASMGDEEAAALHAGIADRMSRRTGSHRQRVRLKPLLDTKGE